MTIFACLAHKSGAAGLPSSQAAAAGVSSVVAEQQAFALESLLTFYHESALAQKWAPPSVGSGVSFRAGRLELF